MFGKEAFALTTARATKTSFKRWIHAALSFITFISSNIGEVFWIWILKDCIKVQEKKKKVVVLCLRPPQNVKLGTFTFNDGEGYENVL